ncbi:MAG TPA: VWA domain-containing protein [Candidatus Aquilonibacter sp.]|nr:VWA domain-containing protein [Candidatus Aquilonibacter sp.]
MKRATRCMGTRAAFAWRGGTSMPLTARLGRFLLATLLMGAAASAQQTKPAAQPNDGRINLDVVVTPKSGPPVGDLQEQDFTLLDNKTPRPITFFKAVNGRQAAVEIVLVIDAINANYLNISYQRAQIDKLLHADEGRLTHPMALALFTDRGTQILADFSVDGNVLSAALDREDVALRSLTRNSGFWGATERWQLSLSALTDLLTAVEPEPGRKIVICVSPGWPLLSSPRIDLDGKMLQTIFTDAVKLSTQMRRGRFTLYNVNPLGPEESPLRASYYEQFLRGINTPNQAQMADLGLQVLAVQSGGLAPTPGNDITGALHECLADIEPFYEISFDPAPADHPDEYHRLDIRIARPGLIARTKQGYYAQPAVRN